MTLGAGGAHRGDPPEVSLLMGLCGGPGREEGAFTATSIAVPQGLLPPFLADLTLRNPGAASSRSGLHSWEVQVGLQPTRWQSFICYMGLILQPTLTARQPYS